MKKKLKVKVIFEFDEIDRRALNAHIGKTGLATRDECSTWMWMALEATLQQIVAENEDDEETPRSTHD